MSQHFKRTKGTWRSTICLSLVYKFSLLSHMIQENIMGTHNYVLSIHHYKHQQHHMATMYWPNNEDPIKGSQLEAVWHPNSHYSNAHVNRWHWGSIIKQLTHLLCEQPATGLLTLFFLTHYCDLISQKISIIQHI